MLEKILVVDDEDIIRESLSFILKKEGYSVEEAANGKEAYDKLKENQFDLVISDLEMPVMKGTELLEEIKRLDIKTSVIIVTAFGSLDTAIKALRNGAGDYILKPVEFDELLIKIRRLFDIKSILLENRILRGEIQRNFDFEKIIGKSSAMKSIYQTIKTVAETDSTVLITGKSGTGKELVARALHFHSRRKNKPFIAVNCGAITENLMESELFGHKKGAFTGAVSDKEGYVKAAEGGTLFLDEISELPLLMQVKFLRVLQEKEYTPVGTTNVLPVNVRFLASTNRDLKEEIKSERFREDLYYRLNVVEVNLPGLQDRVEDIPLLADHFLNKYRIEMNKNIKGIDNMAIRALMTHKWKGEVRELENVIERAVIFAGNDFITIKDLPPNFQQQGELAGNLNSGSLEEAVRNYERDLIMKALEGNEFNKEKTAEVLKVGLSTLYRKLKELDIKS
ncbi:MAG TPA: sigma-54 dependent transcriptional regulator [Ignavibacteriaceae bacterium]|nr:sigma-54 dependent transcriptional regulator [Ignavibacteriaceae bacterium]